MIQFANPAALWLLTIIAPLILLYLLKRKRKEIVVPSLLLWKQALDDYRAQTPFQKLRSHLLLLIQILIIVLVTTVLSKPSFLEKSHPSRRWIFVMDTSASMKSTDVKPERFSVAQNQLLKILNTISETDEILLISFSSKAFVVQYFSRDLASVRSKILELRPEDISSSWEQLRLILSPLSKEKPRPKIVIASDFSNFPMGLQKEIPFDAIPVGKTGENIGIIRAVLQPVMQKPENQTLFYQIKNFCSEKRLVDVELSMNEEVIDAYQKQLAAFESLDRSIDLLLTAPGRVGIRLKPEDSLTADNDFTLTARPAQKTKVQLASSDPFLLKALKVLPSVELSSEAKIKVADLTDGKMDESDLMSGIFFMRAPQSASAGRIIQWNESHPSLRFVDAGLWRLSHHAPLDLPAGADVILETDLGPAGYALEGSGRRRLVLGFAITDSNLPLFGGFPVFLHNSIEWIRQGMEQTIPSLTGGELKNEGAFQRDGVEGFANFADPVESNIVPGKLPAQSISGTQTIVSRRDVSLWFLLLLIAIVILEWWAFHQRIDNACISQT